MTRQELLFTLIRRGLGLPTDPAFPSLPEKEWHEIRQLARTQQVEALCFEGISGLPILKRPSTTLQLEWGAGAIRTERQVRRLNNILEEITGWLRMGNIGFIVLKGSAAASRYPEPHRRECGDIDLLITAHDFASACLLLQQKGAAVTDVSPEKHTAFLWQGIVIELHHTLIDFSSPQAIRYIRHMDFHTVSTTALIDGSTYPVLIPAFDCAYMMAHLLHHLWTDGVRLRQVCDWMMLMHRHGEKIDREVLTAYLRQMQLSKMFPVLLGIGIRYFGLPLRQWGKYVSVADYRQAKKLLQYIFQPEPHENHNKQYKRHPGFLKHWKNMILYTSHLWRFRQLSPIEAIWFLPTRIRRFLYKKYC